MTLWSGRDNFKELWTQPLGTGLYQRLPSADPDPLPLEDTAACVVDMHLKHETDRGRADDPDGRALALDEVDHGETITFTLVHSGLASDGESVLAA